MENPLYSAFLGTRLLATGTLPVVLTAAYPFRTSTEAALLIFDHASGIQTDFDWRGSIEEVIARTRPLPAKTGPGRPKLGVVSTEVTLLPRHWEWLNAQPARASGTLRRLVEEAIRRDSKDQKKRREILGKILWALAGNEVGFEEISRALYAGDLKTVLQLSAKWSGDLPTFVATRLQEFGVSST